MCGSWPQLFLISIHFPPLDPDPGGKNCKIKEKIVINCNFITKKM